MMPDENSGMIPKVKEEEENRRRRCCRKVQLVTSGVRATGIGSSENRVDTDRD